MSKIAVVLMNLGGPANSKSIEPFLFNLFSDPDIFNIPFGQKFLARLIAKFRAPKVAKDYALIGNDSPINKWTEEQRKKLEEKLSENYDGVKVLTAFRYSPPFTKEAALEIARNNYSKTVLLPLYPHYSYSTTRSSFNEWERVFKGDVSKVSFVKSFHLNEKYIAALVQRVQEELEQFKDVHKEEITLLFSAHGTPVSMQKAGDPYSEQIKETVNAVKRFFPKNRSVICYQSKVGPVKWLKPSIKDVLEECANTGQKHLLVIPISFVSDHFETLFELNIFYRRFSEEIGIKQFRVTKGLNDSPLLIEALYEEVVKKLEAE